MTKKRFVFPWEEKVTLKCPRCDEVIWIHPLLPWEKPEDKIRELQPFFCHTIDISLIKQAQILTENDAKCARKLEEFQRELFDQDGKMKTPEELKPLLATNNGPPEILLKHGIFPLLLLFTKTGRKILYLLLCVNTEGAIPQRFFMKCLSTSRANVSSIIKKLRRWGLVSAYRGHVKGRANGRQLFFSLNTVMRERLDKDLSECDFFRESVKKTIRPLALSFSFEKWRTDLELLDREK